MKILQQDNINARISFPAGRRTVRACGRTYNLLMPETELVLNYVRGHT